MKQLTFNQWRLIVIGLVLFMVIITMASTLVWSSTRFTRTSGCTICHETFVNAIEYSPHGELSTSLEDFNPIEVFDPGLFNVTVGCGECHAYPYNEYLESPHYDNDFGVRPGCVGCHDPHTVWQVMSWKFLYVNTGGIGESPFHAISNSIRDVPAWEELRVELAKKVREDMIADESSKCHVCHKTESEWFNDIKRHQAMLEEDDGRSCIHCHYNLVHAEVDWEDET